MAYPACGEAYGSSGETYMLHCYCHIYICMVLAVVWAVPCLIVKSARHYEFRSRGHPFPRVGTEYGLTLGVG